MRTYIVRDSPSDDLYVVVTNLPGASAPYRQYAVDIQGRRDALDPTFDVGNVDIDVFEVPEMAISGTIPLVFEGD